MTACSGIDTMSRVPPLDIDVLEGPVGDALRERPGKLNIVSMMAHAQGCVVQQLQLGRAVNSQQDLDPLSRELLILLAAHLDEGEYVRSEEHTSELQSLMRIS